MPTVYLPLGSAEAFGQMGELIVYQGVSCRKYVVPFDPRTDDQLAQRHRFADFTHVLARLGLFGKGLLAGYFGPRWYTQVCQVGSADQWTKYNLYAGQFDGFTSTHKDQWDAASPYLVTWDRPGRVFLAVARVLAYMVEQITGGDFMDVYAGESNAAAYRVAWDQNLGDVILLSKVDDTDSRIHYGGTWTTPTQAGAYEGAYHQSIVPNSYAYFYIRAKTFKIGFHKAPDQSDLDLIVDNLYEETISEYGATVQEQQTYSYTSQYKGIHQVALTKFTSGSQKVNVDFIDGVE
jgi:hypothetical protein